MITSMNVYGEIRRLQLDGKTSKREAAKLLGISRNTVAKYWEGGCLPDECKEHNRRSTVITDDVAAFIEECLEDDKREGIKKQQHTARRIYQRLVDEKGFDGSESSVRRAVHSMRAEREAIDVYVPLAFPAGNAIQIDWGEAKIYIAGEKTTVNLFCARMCYSCAPFVVAYYRQNEESFLDAIVCTLKYFGGTPRRLIFDNARVAVKSGFGKHAAAQDDYATLSAHYGFEPVFCNPASGNEKGLVENLVGYIRRNVCVPLPHVHDLDELNSILREQCVKYLTHKIDSRPSKVGVMLEEDRSSLQQLPLSTPDISKKAFPVVGRYSTVLFETNRYSVPCKYRGKSVTVKAFPNTIQIWLDGEMIATHVRLYERKKESLSLDHYLPILAQKGRAICYAKPLQAAAPPEFIPWLMKQTLDAKQTVELLEKCLSIGFTAVMSGDVLKTSSLAQIDDPVTVAPTDLVAYDKLMIKEVSNNA